MLLDHTRQEALRITGSEAEAFLHRILANRVKGLEPGQGNRNLLLSSKGKVLHAMELEREAEGFHLEAEPGDAAALATALDMYLFSEDVQIEDASAHCAPLWLLGPEAPERLREALGCEAPEPGRVLLHEWSGHRLRIAGRQAAGLTYLSIDGGPAAAAPLWQALTAAGVTPGGLAALDSLRVEAGLALWGRDVDDGIYPQEARWEHAFSLDKGCYIGQEVVAKIDTYGGLNKRLMGLALDFDEPVAPGTRIYREDGGEWRDLGIVTTWAYSFALDGGLALAYVKRKHQEPGTRFRIGEGEHFGKLVDLPVPAATSPA